VANYFRADADEGAEQARDVTGIEIEVFRYHKYLHWGWAWGPKEET